MYIMYDIYAYLTKAKLILHRIVEYWRNFPQLVAIRWHQDRRLPV